jgi:hypothetical protein
MKDSTAAGALDPGPGGVRGSIAWNFWSIVERVGWRRSADVWRES